MSEFAPLLRAIVRGEDLDAAQMSYAIGAIMDAEWTPAQGGAFLAALATKGETPREVVGAARAMRDRAVRVTFHDDTPLLDTCGTGGDGANTINVSTAAALVVAGAGSGAAVAKHGNRAASSACGSADVLEKLGVPIDAPPERAERNLSDIGFAFLFAPAYHPAARVVAPIRRELGIRTIFNVLGPLANPARPTHQVVGVATIENLELVGNALIELGTAGGAVVRARSGIDEVAGDVPTDVFRFGPGGARRTVIDPAEYGIGANANALRGGDAAENADALLAILRGERSDRADVVALNAALAFVVAQRADDIAEGLALARQSLASGAALDVLERLRSPFRLEFA